MKAFISIIDELYNTLHIPCVIFDENYQLIHPKITVIDIRKFLDDVFTMTHYQVHILVYDHNIAYARIQVTYENKKYTIVCACILNDLQNPNQTLPKSWTKIVPESMIRSHIASLHFMAFQNFVKMLYEMICHEYLPLQSIHVDYIQSKQAKKKDDILTHRRMTQETPDYYHFEQSLLKAYQDGHFYKVKALLNQIDIKDTQLLTQNILQDFIYKVVSFITLITRINIQEGVSSELAFSLSDATLNKLSHITNIQELITLFQQSIYDFYHQLNETKKDHYSLHVYKCIHYIDTHLYDKISLSHLVEHTGLSESYLSAAFKKEIGETMTHYIQRKKADEAARLLLFTNKSHIEISCLLNYSSQSNFIQIFKKYKHMTPKQYQQSHLKDY